MKISIRYCSESLHIFFFGIAPEYRFSRKPHVKRSAKFGQSIYLESNVSWNFRGLSGGGGSRETKGTYSFPGKAASRGKGKSTTISGGGGDSWGNISQRHSFLGAGACIVFPRNESDMI